MAPCNLDITCQNCTDVWADEKLDLERRSQFIDNSKFVRYLTPDVVGRSEELLMLLPIAVYAYALQARKWRAICIDDVEPLSIGGKDPFDDLVMDSGQKTLIQALVKNQIRQFDRSTDSSKEMKQPRHQSGTMDIIEGKGRGLIILLHGVPGASHCFLNGYMCPSNRNRCRKNKHSRVRCPFASTPSFPGHLRRSGYRSSDCGDPPRRVLHSGPEMGMCSSAGRGRRVPVQAETRRCEEKCTGLG
jgi:hypothetical protein